MGSWAPYCVYCVLYKYCDMDSGFLLLCTYYTPLPGQVYRIAHMATPAPSLDAVVAMRSESRTGLRAMAIVIFSFCFFETLYCTVL